MRYRKVKQMICISLAILIAWSGSWALLQAKEKQVQESLAEEVFRFHVIANSNSERDQVLKMLVKEKVIAYMEEKLPESDSVEMTKEWAVSNMQEIEQIAEQTLRTEGCDDFVHGQVLHCYFPDKTYGDVTFPKGYYDALRIEIGAAEGNNWWCVLYPNLCFIDAVHAVVPDEGKDKLRKVLDKEEYEMVTALSRFRVGWLFF